MFATENTQWQQELSQSQQEPQKSQREPQIRQQEPQQWDIEMNMYSPAAGANVEVDELVEWTKMLNDTDLGT